jgi:hypothetical protein
VQLPRRRHRRGFRLRRWLHPRAHHTAWSVWLKFVIPTTS